MGDKKKTPEYIKYVVGGLSGMGGTCVVQPLDLVKTRMQIQGVGGAAKEYSNTLQAFTGILRKEGLGIYKGLGAGLLRQATYTTARLGVYNACNDLYREKTNKAPNLLASMGMGMIAGSCGAIVGTPAEVILIRMTADGRLPLEQRRNYGNVLNALVRITSEEGVATLWRGVIPTMGRAMVVNAAQLASYTQSKIFLVNTAGMNEGIGLHFTASMFSGFVTTVASLPVDIAKTRIQNMKTLPGGVPEYTGTLDVLTKVARHEGVTALWKGFTPYYCRLGPHTVITFILMEQLNRYYQEFINKE